MICPVVGAGLVAVRWPDQKLVHRERCDSSQSCHTVRPDRHRQLVPLWQGVTMTMLADRVEFVIGVDTHKDSHTAALVDRFGGVTETFEFPASRAGYREVLR